LLNVILNKLKGALELSRTCFIFVVD